MKKIFFTLSILFVTTIAFAQSQNESVKPPSDNYVKKKKTSEATQKAYFKKVSKKSKKNNDCDCPGNPKNKKNKKNPYKRKRGGY